METLDLRKNRPDKIYKITLDGKEFVKITDKLPINNIIDIASLQEKGEKIKPGDIKKMIEIIKDIILLKTESNIVEKFIKKIDTKDVIDIFAFINEKCGFSKLDEKKN